MQELRGFSKDIYLLIKYSSRLLVGNNREKEWKWEKQLKVEK